jgi:glycosyltransferase involved in cell wall biosynthesis
VSAKQLIFATRRPPFPLDSGARIRAQRLAAGLAKRFELTLVTFADGPIYDDTGYSVEDLERVLPGVRIELVPYGRRHPRGFRRELLRRTSVSFGAYATPSLRAALAALVADQPGAVLHLDDPGVALAGVELPAALRAFAPHNVEHRIVREVARQVGPTHRPFWELEWRKLRSEEHRLWRASDLCVAVSEVDAQTMRAAGARRVAVCPNGADPEPPPPLTGPAPGEPLRLLFVGTAAFWPYELGIAWFVREVMPRLRAEGDGVLFDVVGAPPALPVEAEGVRYRGRVPEVRSHYAGAHALVIPIFQGSGTRLKAIEAAAMGRPIVSTRLGVEGLPLREKEHYLAAETPEEFAAAVAWLRRAFSASPAEVEGMTEAAREAVAPFFWPQLAAHLADVYERELAPT